MENSENELRGETVLVVEDAEAIRKMICAMLTQSGYECVEASNGVDALRILDGRNDIQLVLTDLIMPRMGGAELARHLRRARPELRLLFMSGFSDDPVVRSMEQTPIFLAKPFTLTSLTAKVRETLDRPWAGLPETHITSGA